MEGAEESALSGAFASLGAAAGLGLLVGLQRERAGSELAGFRTFALITVLGAVCGLASEKLGGWPVAAGLIAIGGATAMGNYIALQHNHDRDPGITTEVTILLMFAVGVMTAIGPVSAAVATGVGVALLLHGKERLHLIAGKLGEKDMRAILLFAAITFVVLPVLPDRAFGPFKVLNPHNIWLMVVLVVGISLGGYVAYKVMGQRGGMLLAGLLGGMISSTATTVTYARRSKEGEAATAPALVVILIASSVVYARLLGEISVVAPGFVKDAAWPMGAMMAMGLITVGVTWVMCRDGAGDLPEQSNPTQLKPALIFAALYAGVTLAVAAGRQYLGNRGMYTVAMVSGLTDTDAITLSTARLVHQGELAAGAAWRAIVLALISNMVFKSWVVWASGSRRLLWSVLGSFGAQALVGLAMMLFWRK